MNRRLLIVALASMMIAGCARETRANIYDGASHSLIGSINKPITSSNGLLP